MLQSVRPEGRISVDIVLSGPFSVMITLSGVISETLGSVTSSDSQLTEHSCGQ